MTERRRTWAAQLPTLFAAAGTLFVAVTAFRLAYAGSKGAALDAGIPASDAAWYPWCIEGTLVVASAATVVLPRGQRALGWAVLLAATGISCAANVLHSLDHPGHHAWSPVAAAVPPLALAVCVRLAERVALARTKTWTPAIPPAGVHPTVDAAEDGPRVHPEGDVLSFRPVQDVHPAPQSIPQDSAPAVQVDAPAGVHLDSPGQDDKPGRTVDGGQSGGQDAPASTGPDAAGGQSTPPAGRRTGRARSPKAELAKAIEAELGVKRSRAWALADDPEALARVRAARASLNGHASAGAS